MDPARAHTKAMLSARKASVTGVEEALAAGARVDGCDTEQTINLSKYAQPLSLPTSGSPASSRL